MSHLPHTLEIDRIVLDGLDITPDRAERIRALVEAELARELAQNNALDGLSNTDMRRLEAPAIHIAEPRADGRLAADVACSVARAVRSANVE